MKKSGKEMVVEKKVERNFEREKSELTIQNEVRGYTLNQFIDKNSPFKRTKK